MGLVRSAGIAGPLLISAVTCGWQDHDPCAEISGPTSLAASRDVIGSSGFPVKQTYDEGGALVGAAWDVNQDGRYDYWEEFEGGSRRRAEVDRNLDGFADLWIELDDSGTASAARVDSNLDGAPDRKTPLAAASGLLRADSSPPLDRDNCMMQPGFSEYMENVRTRIYSKWEGSTPGKARVRFAIHPSGCLEPLSVLDSTPSAVGEEILRAMEGVASGLLPPPELKCVHRLNFVGTFSSEARD